MTDDHAATNRLVEVVSPLWSGDHAAAMLGLSLKQLELRGRAGQALVLESSDGALLVPVRQFISVNDRVTVRPGLALLLTVLVGVDPWTVAVHTLSDAPADELNGRTVLEAARDNDFDALFKFAVAVGRELDANLPPPDIHVARVLAGLDSYDEVSRDIQSRVRAAWDQRAAAALEAMNLRDEFIERGQSWTELDDHGQVVQRNTHRL